MIDDYAHHPTEIRATLSAAENYPHQRLVLVFQPHTYSRTKAFLDDFADVLSMADVVVLADIFAAREQNTYGVSSKDILSRLKAKGTEAYYFPSFEEIEKFLLKNCVNGDLLITMGAGNIVEIGEATIYPMFVKACILRYSGTFFIFHLENSCAIITNARNRA